MHLLSICFPNNIGWSFIYYRGVGGVLGRGIISDGGGVVGSSVGSSVGGGIISDDGVVGGSVGGGIISDGGVVGGSVGGGNVGCRQLQS